MLHETSILGNRLERNEILILSDSSVDSYVKIPLSGKGKEKEAQKKEKEKKEWNERGNKNGGKYTRYIPEGNSHRVPWKLLSNWRDF